MSDQVEVRAPSLGRQRWARWLLVGGLAGLAFNLRPVAISVGPVLDELMDSLRMSGTAAGVLTMMPVVVFAAVGLVVPSLAQRVSLHRLLLFSLLAVALGAFVRVQTDALWVFLLMSLLALAGMATANVLLPPLIKVHFPSQVRFGTSVYTTAMALGQTLAAASTVPISREFERTPGEGWRVGLLAWAVTALLAALPWMLISLPRRGDGPPSHPVALRHVGRTRLGWAMAVFFGLQSLQAYAVYGWFAQLYRDSGASATTAGLLLGLITFVSVPLSFLVPRMIRRPEAEKWVMIGLVTCYPVAYLGMLAAPIAGAWLWAVLVGMGGGAFPLALTLLSLRARTAQGTAALSGFTQAVGYAIAAAGPLGMGLLHDITGDWTIPLTVLALLSVPQLMVGLVATRSVFVEDSLPQSATSRPSADRQP